jgi:hypothetical protein
MSETRTIEALMGPFRHSIITIDKADADKAIKDGWARDPFNNFAEPVEVDSEKALAAAEAAAKKIRGEPEAKPAKSAPKEEKQAAPKPAAERGAYETRDVKATTTEKK